MIEIDIREALKNEGKVYIFQYEGAPALGEDISLSLIHIWEIASRRGDSCASFQTGNLFYQFERSAGIN